MQEEKIQEGIVGKINKREVNYSFQMDGTWFSGFLGKDGSCPVKEGDNVRFKFKTSPDGKFNNITAFDEETITPFVPKGVTMSKAPMPSVNLSIRIGQALNQAAELTIEEMKGKTKFDFWTEYSKNVENFFNTNKRLEQDILSREL